MSALQDKLDSLLRKLEGLDICTAEAEAARMGGRHYDEAERARGSALKSGGAAGATIGGGAAVGIGCGIATLTGVGAAVCLAGAAFGLIGGALWFDSAADDEGIAEDQMDDALRELQSALDKLCTCVMTHDLQSHP